MILQVLGNLIDTLGEDTDLHLWGTCVLLVRLELSDDLGLGCLLESHTVWGDAGKRMSEPLVGTWPVEKYGSRGSVLATEKKSSIRAKKAVQKGIRVCTEKLTITSNTLL